VTPKVVLLTQAVELSGTGCPRSDEVLTGVTTPVISNRDGSWKLDETVPISDPIGQRTFGAYCFRRSGRTMVFSYPPAHVRISKAAPGGARFTVSPKRLMIGQPVHVTGTDCPHGDDVVTDFGRDSPATSGAWSLVRTVDQSTLIGTVPIAAECVATPSQYEVFTYPPVTVKVNTFRHLRVTPGTIVRAGTTLAVSSVGPCPMGGSPYGYVAEVNLAKGSRHKATMSESESAQKDVGGQEWSSTLVIPAGLAPGHYLLSATCELQGESDGSYNPVTIIVTSDG
jgi:hypothetical protein